MRQVLLIALIASLMMSCSAADHPTKPVKKDPVEQLNWRLGMQAWTLRKLTLYETIDTCNRLGVRYLEMYPGQKLSPEQNVKADHNLPPEQVDLLIAKLKGADVTAVSYGVVDFGKDEASARKVFGYAKKLGLEEIVTESPAEMMPMLDNLSEEYRIKVAIHDHPKPSRYWNPESVIQACTGRSDRIGCCADVGHWRRSGLVPVECMQKLQGRIISFHLKDINEAKEDVVWGTGLVDIRGVLVEAKRQGLKNPLFAIEYETGEGQELIDNVTKCIHFFNTVAAELAASK